MWQAIYIVIFIIICDLLLKSRILRTIFKLFNYFLPKVVPLFSEAFLFIYRKLFEGEEIEEVDNHEEELKMKNLQKMSKIQGD